MTYQLITTQEVTSQYYPTQYLSSPSTSMDEIDIAEFPLNILSNLKQKNIKRSFSLISVLENDLSSIWPRFEIKSETASIEEVEKEKVTEIISEEDIALEMVENDFVVKMPPKKKYEIHVLVKNIKRGEPT